MPSTKENLETAFAGESQANRKYTAFARKAKAEGFDKIALLFKTISEAETIHALGHLDALDGVGSTEENLKAALEGETYEVNEMYPPMLEQAKADGHKGARMFGLALSAEKVHAKLYAMALEAVAGGKDLGDDLQFYLCPVCGNIEIGQPTTPCVICSAPADRFAKYHGAK